MSNTRYSYNNPAPLEKIVAMLTYINCWIGFIWIIIAALLRVDMKPFLRYHIFQSIFLAFALFIIKSALDLLLGLINYIPVINKIINICVNFFFTPVGIFFGYSIIQTLIFIIVLYLALTALMGKYSYLPWVSDIIKQNIRG